jgi:hypothetical protein
MTNLYILDIIPNCEFNDVIWDYYIEGIVDNNKIILFDRNCFADNLQSMQVVEIVIKSIFVSSQKQDGLYCFEGCFQSFSDEDNIFIGKGIEILVDKKELASEHILCNDEKNYYFGRLDLISIK